LKLSSEDTTVGEADETTMLASAGVMMLELESYEGLKPSCTEFQSIELKPRVLR